MMIFLGVVCLVAAVVYLAAICGGSRREHELYRMVREEEEIQALRRQIRRELSAGRSVEDIARDCKVPRVIVQREKESLP